MDTRQLFNEKGQGQVFEFWDTLTDSERKNLLEQAREIDLDELENLITTLVKGSAAGDAIDFETLAPAPYVAIPKDGTADDWTVAREKGQEALRAGKVAAFTVAGGQGTRLGYDGPKGTFPVTPVKAKTLFQVFAEKILAARIEYGCQLPWYIMTSHLNHEATEAFFSENAYFGLGADSVCFFKQGRMPAVDLEGKIILESPSSIAMSPDGHGGALRALERSGALAEMEKSGIESMSYFQVDNALVNCIDPVFVGFHLDSGSSMSSKMIPKAYEKEKLGHFCSQNGQMVVVEYSDMPDDVVSRRDASGELLFRSGSIAIHMISVGFIRKLVSKGSQLALPFHKALKKIAFANADGETCSPNEPNGFKFEMFVFDALPFAENPLVLETTRLADFSPVKNAQGVDSPASSRADQKRLFALWFESVGVSLEKDSEGVPLQDVEVSPLFGFDQASFRKSWEALAEKPSLSESIYLG